MVHITAVGAGLGDLAGQTGGSHLAAGHAVNGVVDEDDGDVLVTGSGMDGLSHTDGSQVTVTLIGEHDVLRAAALDAGGSSGGSAVGSFDHIAVKVVVSHDCAANGSNTDGLTLDAQLVDDLRHQAMDNAVGAAGAVMQRNICQRLGFFKYNSHN